MTSHGIHTRRLSAALAALALAAASVLVGTSPASAHDELVSTDPAADAVLDAAPTQLTLTFSGELVSDGGATVLEVTDASGASLTAGDPDVDANVVTQPLTGEGSGAVRVLWKVVSGDGHPISGEYTFAVGDGSNPVPTDTPLYPDMTVDWGATLLVNLLPVLAVVIVAAVVVTVVVASRRRRRG